LATRLHAAMLPILPRRLERARAARDRSARLLPVLGHARLAAARAELEVAAAGLSALGPEATLERGYAIVRRATDARIVRSPVEAPAGASLRIRLAGGEIGATTDGT